MTSTFSSNIYGWWQIFKFDS